MFVLSFTCLQKSEEAAKENLFENIEKSSLTLSLVRKNRIFSFFKDCEFLFSKITFQGPESEESLDFPPEKFEFSEIEFLLSNSFFSHSQSTSEKALFIRENSSSDIPPRSCLLFSL